MTAFGDSQLTITERSERKLRLALENVDKNLTALTTAPSADTQQSRMLEDLRGSFQVVLDLLALEPEPERRACPFCGGPMRRLATRCVHCWKKSDPS